MAADPPQELQPEESAALAAALRRLRAHLDAALDGSRSAAKPVDLDEPIGRVSRIDAIAQQEMARAGHASLQLRARQVHAALERVEEGTYGSCITCGENVGFPRLQARPETPFCIGCQSRRERR